MRFSKYHALGNDYIVLNPRDFESDLTEKQIRLICHRHYGIGSDGILVGPLKPSGHPFALKIFNPDGSEAEKSGNGLRIFARYLCDAGYVKKRNFTILTSAGKATVKLHDDQTTVTVDMGPASFESAHVPVSGTSREVINEEIKVADETLTFCAVTVGNPHCVILCDDISEAKTRKLGPVIETDSRFPNRTNVQFMKVLDRSNIAIEIWERGAGYTLASGTSSCAAAAVAYRLGLCQANIVVHMPGGKLNILVSDDFSVTMTGPVAKVTEGTICEEMFNRIGEECI